MSVPISRLLKLAIGTPEKGAMNLNALYEVLKVMVKEMGLEDIPVEYEENELSVLMEKNFGKQDFYDDDSLEDLKVKLQESYDNDYDAMKWSKHDCEDLAKRTAKIEEQLEELMKIHSNMDSQGATEFKEGVKKKEEIFDMTMEEMGEAVTRVGMMLRQQKEMTDELLSENKINDICQIVVNNEMEKRDKVMKQQIQSLASALKNIQLLIKEALYPESGATTGCLTCGRPAHLPEIELLLDKENEVTSGKGKFKLPPLDKSYSESKKKEPPHPLYFTKLAMERLEKKKVKIFAENQEEGKIELRIDEDDKKELLEIVDSNDLNLTDVILPPAVLERNATSMFVPLRFIQDPHRRRSHSHK